jgi:aromatic-L-amino-acid decarboxylase
VVCFRYRPPELDPATASGLAAADALNERIMETVNASGEMFVSHTKINGAFALRMAIGNVQTTSDDVRAAWGILREAARAA